MRWDPATARLETSAAVLVGRVVSVRSAQRSVYRYDSPRWERVARVVVTEAVKGVAAGDTAAVQFLLETRETAGNCGWAFDVGKSYLIYAGSTAHAGGAEPADAPLVTSYCHGTERLECAAPDLKALGAPVPPGAGDCRWAPPPERVRARPPERAITLAAGMMSFDASGTGTATVTSLSIAQTLGSRWIVLEAGATYAGLNEQFRDSPTRTGILEGQLQLQWPTNRLRPYLGAGGGVVHYFTHADGRPATEPAVSFGAGLRAALTETWGARLDGRIRGWKFGGATDWAVNSSVELTFGVSLRF